MLRSMFQKFLVSPAGDQDITEGQTSGLRVAVPTFGLPGIRAVEDVVVYERASRSELEELFADELSIHAPKEDTLSGAYTKGEQYEIVMTSLLRTALYDDEKAA